MDPEPYRAALRDRTCLMVSMNPEEKRRLPGYLVEKVALGGDGITLFLRSETLETPDVDHPEGEYPRGGEWLRNRVHSDNSERAVQMTWVVEERIPPVPRRKPRRRRRAQRRKRGPQDAAATPSTQAGHAKSKRGGGTSATEPRKRRAGQASGPPVDRWTVALDRVRAALDRADGWQAWTDAEPGRTAADLARKEELSRARVCQVLKLRRLSREVVDDIRREGRSGPVPSEADMRRVAGLPVRDQWERYAEMVNELRAAKRRGPAMPRTDYRFDLQRARVWRAELEADDRLTLADIARREGYASRRVSQVLNLLELAPEILAVLDVEEDKLPMGLLRKEIRRIAWMREHEEQRAEFERLWPGVLGTSAAET